MTNIGILGGTFDPPHNAHIAMARAALDRLPLQKVLFMPAPRPPHKDPHLSSPYELRKKMVELAIEGERGIELSLMEEERDGPSYTHELLESLRSETDNGLYLILGSDSVADLANWRDPKHILELSTLVVFPRTGYASTVPIETDVAVVFFEEPIIDVSSTEIRERYRRGEPVVGLLPSQVHQFILDNSLYS